MAQRCKAVKIIKKGSAEVIEVFKDMTLYNYNIDEIKKFRVKISPDLHIIVTPLHTSHINTKLH